MTYPGVGISLGVSRTAGAAARRAAHLSASRSVPSAVLVALTDEASRAASDRVAQRLRGRGVPPRWPPPAEVRQADPVRRAPWHPLRVVPGHRRPARPGQGHPQRRPARGRSGDVDPARATTCDPQISDTRGNRQGATPVIRTHDAGTPARRARRPDRHPRRVGRAPPRPRRRGVHRPARGVSGVVQVVIRDEAVAYQLRAEYCLKVTGEVRRAPRATRTPTCPPARSR